MYTDWRKDNYFQAVKEAIGDTTSYDTPTFKIGIEFDHMSVQASQKLQNLYSGILFKILILTIALKL